MTGPEFHRRLRRVVLASLGIAAAAAVYYILASRGIGLSCPVYTLTGLQCPGCGNTRAAVRLLQLDIAGALACNPMFLPQIGYIAWVWLCCCVSYLQGGRFSYKPPLPALDICLLAALILWGILRNLVN